MYTIYETYLDGYSVQIMQRTFDNAFASIVRKENVTLALYEREGPLVINNTVPEHVRTAAQFLLTGYLLGREDI